jgi:hypothetical protein
MVFYLKIFRGKTIMVFPFTQKAGTRKIFRGKTTMVFHLKIFRGKTMKERSIRSKHLSVGRGYSPDASPLLSRLL